MRRTLRRSRLDPRGRLDIDRLARVAFVCLALASAAWIMREGRGLIFFYDEWSWLLARRDGLDGLLEPHNGHFALLPLTVFKALFASVGTTPYWGYRLVAVLVHVACAGLLFELTRRRAGAGVALASAAVLLLLGAAWQVVLWPFQISYTLSIAAGLGALLALDRSTRRANVVASALVLASLASSGLGLAVAAGVLVELLLDPRNRRRTIVALAPLAVYAAWYVGVSPESDAKRGNIDAIPGYAADAAAGAVGAVVGLGVEWGRVLVALLAIAVVARLLAPGPLPARLAGLLTTGAVYWGLLGLARADLNEPLASRYVYFGAVLALLIAAEVVRSTTFAPRAWIVLALAVACSVVANLGDLRDGAAGLRSHSGSLRAALAATELAGDKVAPTTKPEPVAAPQLTAGPYRELVADEGSPVGGPAAVLRRGPADAVAVDAALARLLGVTPVAATAAAVGATAPRLLAVVGGRVREQGSCLRFSAAGADAAIDVKLDAGDAVVLRDASAPAQLRLRRFAAEFSVGPLGEVAASATAALRTPPDRIGRPWVLRLSASGSLRVCSAGAR